MEDKVRKQMQYCEKQQWMKELKHPFAFKYFSHILIPLSFDNFLYVLWTIFTLSPKLSHLSPATVEPFVTTRKAPYFLIHLFCSCFVTHWVMIVV